MHRGKSACKSPRDGGELKGQEGSQECCAVGSIEGDKDILFSYNETVVVSQCPT